MNPGVADLAHVLLIILLLICIQIPVDGFYSCHSPRLARNSLRNDRLNDDVDDPTQIDWSKLQTEVARKRLEDANTRTFLKSGAKCLSYAKCKEWIHRNGYGWRSKAEWEEYIRNGENLQWFIPSDPKSYYTNVNAWISWEDFLGI